mgnify:CR=1 FL=1|tara:strand:+ start:746 stop:3124 length:2379 start_codon:yes stop_codon:yes gene_type:complete
MTSVLSYKNLIDLAEYINSPNPDADTYPYEYANRQGYFDGNYLTIDSHDVEALLSNLVGDVTFDWVGKNCGYTMENPNCTANAGQLVRELNINDNKYSKCYYIPSDYGSDSVPPNEYRIKKSGANTLDCPNLEICGSNLSYIWNMKPTTSYEGKLADYFQNGGLNPIFKPYSIEGNCQQVYGANGGDNNVTTDINDPYIKKENGSPVETNDGKYECMNQWTPIKDADNNNVETVVGEEISTDSSASDLAQKCARTGIYYGGNYDNGEYVGGEFLLPESGVRDGAQSAPCIINATDALYVKKGDRNVLCDDTEPLYPGDDYEAQYDLPLDENTPNREEWWDNNSCVWKNVILDNYNSSIRGGNPAYTNYNIIGLTENNPNTFFTPKKLNGKCDYLTAQNVFTSKDDNGSATSIDEYCSDSGDGKEKPFCTESQYRESLIGEIDFKKYAETLKSTPEEQARWLTSLSQDIYPGLTHPGNSDRNSNSGNPISRFDEAYYYSSPDSPIREKCLNNIHRYQWVDENENIGSNMSSKTQEDLADMSIDSNDINGKFMKFTKSNTINRKYKTHCYVEENSSNGTGTTKYLLPYNREYRAVNEDSVVDPGVNPQTVTKDYNGSIIEGAINPQPLSFTNTSYNSNYEIDNTKAWLPNSDVNKLKTDGTHILRESSDGIDIIKLPHTSTSPIPSHQAQGLGSGECWGIVQLETRPQYKNEDNLYNSSDTSTKKFFDSLESVDNIGTSTLKIKSIKESIAENVGPSDYLYYNIGRGAGGTKECPDPEDALSQLTYAWVEQEDS